MFSAPKESESVEDNLKSNIAKMTPVDIIFQGQDDFMLCLGTGDYIW